MLFLIVIVLPVGLEAAVHSRLSDVDDLHAALDAVQSARGQIRDRQSKKAAIALRYQKHTPALAGLLEQLATAQKLEVVDSVDRPDQPRGKKFTERATTIHLKKAGMLPISKFLESVEQSGYPVTVSQINLRKRAGELRLVRRRSHDLVVRPDREHPVGAGRVVFCRWFRWWGGAMKERLKAIAPKVGSSDLLSVLPRDLRPLHVPVRQAARPDRPVVQPAAARDRRHAGAQDRPAGPVVAQRACRPRGFAWAARLLHRSPARSRPS